MSEAGELVGVVDAREAAARTGLAHAPATMLERYPQAVVAGSRLLLAAFTTATVPAGQLPVVRRLA